MREALEAHFELQQQVAALKEKHARTAAAGAQQAVAAAPAMEEPVTKGSAPQNKPVVDERELPDQNQSAIGAGRPSQGETEACMELSEWRVAEGGVLYGLAENGQWVPFYEGQPRTRRGGPFPDWGAMGFHPN